jgi:hypothetical protein
MAAWPVCSAHSRVVDCFPPLREHAAMHSARSWPLLFVISWLLAAACDPTGGGTAGDAGAIDSGEPGPNADGGPDASATDAGEADASTDAGGHEGDAGPVDAGSDAGHDDAGDGDGDGGLDGGDGDADAGDGDTDGGTSTGEVPCGRLGELSTPSGSIFDLGHGWYIDTLFKENDRILSADGLGHWALWEPSSRSLLASGPGAVVIDSAGSNHLRPAMAGGLVAVATSQTALELRAASDGHLLDTLTVSIPDLPVSIPSEEGQHYGVATDGSYVWVKNASGLTAWNQAGDVVASRTGSYLNALLFAAPGELRVARGPAGSSVIEIISTITGESSSSGTFLGTFHSWFADGARFFTTASTTVRVYSGDTVQQQGIVALSTTRNLAGYGTYFWTHVDNTPGYPLDIYSLADTSTPIKHLNLASGSWVQAAGDVLGVFSSEPTFDVVRFAEPGAPVSTIEGSKLSPRLFAGTGADDWALSTGIGALIDDSDVEHSLSCGLTRSIAGSSSSRTAIATEAGGVLLFDLTSTGKSYVGHVPFASLRVLLSADGQTLGAAATAQQWQPDRGLLVFALPALTELQAWPYYVLEDTAFNFTMSADATRFGIAQGTLVPRTATVRQVLDLDDSPPYLSLPNTRNEPLVLSADGSLVAAPTGSRGDDDGVSNIYENGILVNVVPGYALTWLDGDRLLVNRYNSSGTGTGSEIYGLDGMLESTPALPHFPKDVQPLGSDLVYSPPHNAIYSLATGAATWTGDAPWGPPAPGAVAGDFVVYASASSPHAVVADPR